MGRAAPRADSEAALVVVVVVAAAMVVVAALVVVVVRCGGAGGMGSTVVPRVMPRVAEKRPCR